MDVRTYEREKLYKEIWAEPMTTVCKRYGISDVALRKRCKKLEIPLPPNGYWSKVKAGQKMKVPPLPKSKVPDKIMVTGSSIANNGNSHGTKKLDTLLFLPENQRLAVKKYCSTVIVPDELKRPHDLIKDTMQYLRSKKESTRPPLNRVLNLGVSDEQKERVYRIFNTLFVVLEQLGYTIDIKAPKAERHQRYERRVHDNVTYICSGADGVPVSIKEMQQREEHIPTKEELAEQKRYSWTRIPTYDFVKTGKLLFEIDEYHSKRKHWRDSDNRKIEDQIGEIIIWIMEAIHVVKTLREQREAEKVRRLEEERLRYQKTEMKKREIEQLELLEQQAANWERAKKIRRFADSVELKIAEDEDQGKKEKITSWLKWARDKANWLDPLTDTEDKLLGKKQSLSDVIFDID